MHLDIEGVGKDSNDGRTSSYGNRLLWRSSATGACGRNLDCRRPTSVYDWGCYDRAGTAARSAWILFREQPAYWKEMRSRGIDELTRSLFSPGAFLYCVFLSAAENFICSLYSFRSLQRRKALPSWSSRESTDEDLREPSFSALWLRPFFSPHQQSAVSVAARTEEYFFCSSQKDPREMSESLGPFRRQGLQP